MSSVNEFRPVLESEVKRLLQDLEPAEAGRPDDILPSKLKMVAGKIAYSVSLLFGYKTASITRYNMANIHPLFKEGKTDPTLASNY